MSEFESKLSEAESTVEELVERSGADDAFEDASEAVSDRLESLGDDADDADGIAGDLREVWRALDEAEDVLESIDFSELPDAVDREQVLEAIELGELPEALRDEEDAEVVKLRRVIRAINFRELLSDVDLTELWQSKRAAEDAIDSLTDDDEDEGVIGEFATRMADDDRAPFTDDGDDDDDELIETDAGDVMEMGKEAARTDFELEGGDLSEYEEIIQQQALAGVDEFRDGLVRAHEKFERVVEENRERTRSIDRRSNSRNPTAVSTIATPRSDVASVANYSTVPLRVRHSNAPGRPHIYGDRFERERERRRDDQ